MKRFTPYVGFGGRCREAMTFYREILGGELTLMKTGDTPLRDQFPAEAQDQILHGALEIGGTAVMGTDMGGAASAPGSVSICIECTTEDELRRHFASLAAGGSIEHDVETFFGGTLGSLIDKFGISWMLHHGPDSKGPKS